MTAVTIKCLKCGIKLGVVDNFWLQLGTERIALITEANTSVDVSWMDMYVGKLDVTGINSHLALEVRRSEAVWTGLEGTFVEGCELMDIVCMSCSAPLGSQIVDPNPEDHVLTMGQYIFLTKSIVLKSTKDGRRKIDPEIQQDFRWDDSPKQQSVGRRTSEDESQKESTDQEQDEPEDVESMKKDPQEYILDKEVAAALRSVVAAFQHDFKQLNDQFDELKSKMHGVIIEQEGLKAESAETKKQVNMAFKGAQEAKSNVLVYQKDIEKLVKLLDTYHPPQSSPASGSHPVGRNLKRPYSQDDDSQERPPKRGSATPDVASATSRRLSGAGSSQRSSPIVSKASRKNGFLSRPARRSSGIWGKDADDQEMEGADDA